MKNLLLMAVMVLLAVSANAERLVRIHSVTTDSVEQLVLEGYDVTASNVREGWVDIMVPDRFVSDLTVRYPEAELLPTEWSGLLPENSRAAGYYYDLNECRAFWCNLAATYPDLVDTPVTIGQSFQGQDIYMIHMTSPVGNPDYKPAITVNSLIHAREPGGLSVVIDYGMWLTSNYDGGDTRAAWILDHTNLYFVPIANPDGYAYNLPGGGNHRKNMNFSVPVSSDGIDLNRNWSYMWGYDSYGSSPDPYDDTYRGSAAFSEDETQVLSSFITSVDPIAAINYHTYGGYLIFPWNYNNSATPHQSTFQSWAAAMTAYNGYSYGRCGQVLGYNSNGDQADWMYGGNSMQAILGFTPEVDDNGFWGGQSDTTLIANFCAECRYMNIWLCMTAPGFVGIGDQTGASIEPAFSVGPMTPNPVFSSASFTVTVPAAAGLDIGIFDLTGRLVSAVPAAELAAGANRLTWNVPDGVPAGIYTLRAVNGSGYMAMERFTVLR
jgi:hypothetical protein